MTPRLAVLLALLFYAFMGLVATGVLACETFTNLDEDHQVGEPYAEADNGLMIVQYDRDNDGVVDAAEAYQKLDLLGKLADHPLFIFIGKKGEHLQYIDRGDPLPSGKCEDIILYLRRTNNPHDQA